MFLPNVSARADDALYRRFGLNDREIEIVAGATPKREYYFKSKKGQRLISLELGALALSFLGVCDKDSITELRRCEERFGRRWPDEWLRRRGLKLTYEDVKSGEELESERKYFNDEFGYQTAGVAGG